jgi:hypothetical protein
MLARDPRQRGEIDMGGQVGAARLGQRVQPGGLSAHRLEAFAESRFGGTVIQDQRRAALHRQAPRQPRGPALRRLPHLLHRPFGRDGGQEGWGFHRPLDEGARRHMPLEPGLAAPDELPDRQRVEEFICQQQHRPVRHLRQPVVPAGHRIPQHPRLRRAQAGGGLHQMHPQRPPERDGHFAHRAQRVRHQRAAARPAFHQQHRVRPAHLLPGDRGPQPEHLAEGLGDLGCRGEVPGPAEGRRLPRVVGRDRPGHVPVQAFRHAGARALAISQPPTRIIGSDSNCPMVAPANRKPRCASGWRKNSPTRRATP